MTSSSYAKADVPGVLRKLLKIESGGVLSDELDLANFRIGAIIAPAELDGTTFNFHAAPKAGGTYVEIKDEADAVISWTVAASQNHAPDGTLAELLPYRHIKVEASTNQLTTDTVLTVILVRR